MKLFTLFISLIYKIADKQGIFNDFKKCYAKSLHFQSIVVSERRQRLKGRDEYGENNFSV